MINKNNHHAIIIATYLLGFVVYMILAFAGVLSKSGVK